MKVLVTGASGVLGQHAVRALLAAGHDVTGLTRNEEKARAVEGLGARSLIAHLFDREALETAFSGYDVVCNLATRMPVGMAGVRDAAWRANDRLRAQGSKIVEEAARSAGVDRLVQESVSLLYADAGEEWITEGSPLTVTRPLEPAAVAEANAASFDGCSRSSVVLRFGTLVGDDAKTRWLVSRARAGRPIGLGGAENWTHIVHPYDAGTAIAAALQAPPGMYNVGAPPIRRQDMLEVIGAAADRSSVRYLPRVLVKLAGDRVEPMMRSHRVSSKAFHARTGWQPQYSAFDAGWLPVPDSATSSSTAGGSPRG